MSAAWAWVQPEVAKITRVCSYDRAGLGWSEAGDGRYIPARVPEELRVLLDRANEIGPIVLVGHEGGALFARMYAARFASNTAALVLIDDPTIEPTPSRADVSYRRGRGWLASESCASRTGFPRSRRDCRVKPAAPWARSSIDPITSRGPHWNCHSFRSSKPRLAACLFHRDIAVTTSHHRHARATCDARRAARMRHRSHRPSLRPSRESEITARRRKQPPFNSDATGSEDRRDQRDRLRRAGRRHRAAGPLRKDGPPVLRRSSRLCVGRRSAVRTTDR